MRRGIVLLFLCMAACLEARHILMPLPHTDFDPSEVAVPWSIFRSLGHTVAFATPSGRMASADPIMLSGAGLGFLRYFLPANSQAIEAHSRLIEDAAFKAPMPYAEMTERGVDGFDAVALPGGHAVGIREYLESPALQDFAGAFLRSGKPIAAICHGVLVLARARSSETGLSVLHGRRASGLPEHMELLAERLVNFWMFGASLSGAYYRTYENSTVESEMRDALGPDPGEFVVGPGAWSLDSVLRDSNDSLSGFALADGALVTARWPGDVNTWARLLDEVMSNYPYEGHDESVHFAALHADEGALDEDAAKWMQADDDEGEEYAEDHAAEEHGAVAEELVL